MCTGGAKPLREKALPGLLDVFGWCTWDAFYSRVSARGARHPGNLAPLCSWEICLTVSSNYAGVSFCCISPRIVCARSVACRCARGRGRMQVRLLGISCAVLTAHWKGV